jgi:hypothetical protein
MKFNSNLPERFVRWIEFELSDSVKKGQYMDHEYLLETFADLIPGRVGGHDNLYSLTSTFFLYYNKYVFDLDTYKDIGNLDFFFNDINLLDNLILDGHSIFFYIDNMKYDRPLLTSVFHFDHYPFYDSYMEPEQLFLAMYPDIMLSSRYPSTLNKPISYFLAGDNRFNFKWDRYRDNSLYQHYVNYYFTRTFLTLLMDEERFYITFRRFVKFLKISSLLIPIIVFSFYQFMPVIVFFLNIITWKFTYLGFYDFCHRTYLFYRFPGIVFGVYAERFYLSVKVIAIFLHDIAIAIWHIKEPKKGLKYMIINEHNKAEKRKKHSNLFYR